MTAVALSPRTAPDRSVAIEFAMRRSMEPWIQLFRPEAFRVLAQTVAVAAPELDDCDLTTLATLGAWICAFDDFADDASVSDDELGLRIAQYDLLLRGRSCAELAFDPVANTFKRVLCELRAAPLGEALWPVFTGQLVAAFRAMQWERAAHGARRRGETVSLDRYMNQATDSICFHVAATAGAMMLGDSCVPFHLAELLRAQRHGAAALRIANDFASWTREQREDSANAFALVHGAEHPYLAERHGRELVAFASALDALPRSLAATTRFTRRLGLSLIEIYRHGDLG